MNDPTLDIPWHQYDEPHRIVSKIVAHPRAKAAMLKAYELLAADLRYEAIYYQPHPWWRKRARRLLNFARKLVS